MLHPIRHDLDLPLTERLAMASAVTGAKTSRIQHLRRRLRGGRTIEEMNEGVFNALMSVLEHPAASSGHAIQPYTLHRFVKHHRHLFVDSTCVVRLRNLLLAVDATYFVSTHHPVPTPISMAPRHWRVEHFQAFGRRNAEGSHFG